MVSLKQHNTFAIDASCPSIRHIYSETDILKAIFDGEADGHVIGGGSNILITQNLDKPVLLNQIKGIEVIDEDDEQLLVSVGAGENWHQFVQWCIVHNLGGLENLSLIPGSVGAAPMQNIGAYGVEQEACFHSLQAIDLESGITQSFYKSDCKFGYRESIFKHEAKGKFFICRVRYMLSKKHQTHTSYGAIQEKLQQYGVADQPTIADVSKAIIEIRQSKLPDPKVLPNSGSFFKNPIVSKEVFDQVVEQYPNAPNYPVNEGLVKIPAAWLIEQCGFKGKEKNGAGTHKNHALVLVNYGAENGKVLWDFAMEIQAAVQKKFGIAIEPEVNVW